MQQELRDAIQKQMCQYYFKDFSLSLDSCGKFLSKYYDELFTFVRGLTGINVEEEVRVTCTLLRSELLIFKCEELINMALPSLPQIPEVRKECSEIITITSS